MAGGALGTQIQLLIIDAVLHLAAGTVEFVVKIVCRLRQVCHGKAGIAADT